MSNFENLKKMSIDELAEWLDKNGQFDTAPWSQWFNDKYCKNCESIKCKYVEAEEKLGFSPFARYGGEIECTYCELEKKCRFFPDLEDIPDNKKVIEMWLIDEVEESEIVQRV